MAHPNNFYWKFFFIAGINMLLRQLMRILTMKERAETYTDYNFAVAFKLFLTMFANTAIIPLITNPNKDDWFGTGGLVVNIYLNILIINFLSPIFYYFNWTFFSKKIKIWLEKKKGEKSKMTQREANKLYEGSVLDVAKGYADITLIFATTAFYTPLIPLLPALSFIGLYYQFWILKYKLLRKCKIPESLGERLALEITSNLPITMI